ncbi:MAG TPA: sensor histidine kinase [Actinomycetota bacterium]|nr:sensor histidine kinase [Actinomycetota bacterium]
MDRWSALRSRLPRLDPLVTDGLLALVAAGLSLAQMQRYPDPQDRSALNITFVLLQTLPLVFRRRAPFTVFAIAALALAVQGTLELQGPLFAFLAVNLALYSLAAYGHRRLAILGAVTWALLLAVRLVQLIVTTWPHVAITDLYDVFDDFVLLGAAWTLGEGVRQRRAHAAALEDRAARLEREREEKARQAAAQERLRIARELHDVVAHSLSVIGVQAGAARLVLDADPDPTRAREAVAAIEATANQAMTEMRRALGILRDTERSGAALAPLPGLGQLPSLLDQMRAAGLAAELTVQGTPRPLATSIDLSAYRIVQEALTNALKHARATRAEVVVCYGAHDIQVEVTDDGRGPPPAAGPSQGAGMIGMRERVALFGGELSMGPRPQRGYAVRVRLPTSAVEP